MATKKGAGLEELIRNYFYHQGYFALRSVPYRFESDDVTDIDVWLYGRQAASGRVRVVVDSKDKKTPKALERILWTKGLQVVTGADRAIVVTTESNPKVTRFSRESKVSLITKTFLDRIQKSEKLNDNRLSLEELSAHIQKNPAHKQDGDWLARLDDAKANLVSLPGFPAFNAAMSGFRFFAEKVETRPLYRDQALRCAYLTAAIACAALDGAIERVHYDTGDMRAKAILDGVTLGDTGDGRAQRSIGNLLNVVSATMENGRVLALQIQRKLDETFSAVRGDIIAEYFSNEVNAGALFPAARELETRAHAPLGQGVNGLSVETKGVLGVFADFTMTKRSSLFSATGSHEQSSSKSDTGPRVRLI